MTALGNQMAADDVTLASLMQRSQCPSELAERHSGLMPEHHTDREDHLPQTSVLSCEVISMAEVAF